MGYAFFCARYKAEMTIENIGGGSKSRLEKKQAEKLIK